MFNGGVIGALNHPTRVSAKGVYNINEQYTYQKALIWPGPGIPMEYLVVAGGGGSLNVDPAGGAGAGGYLEGSILLLGSATVTVGAGGALGAYPGKGGAGSNSVFYSYTSIGGGGGSRAAAAGSGGSGGGGTDGAAGLGTAGQGYDGGTWAATGGASGGGATQAGYGATGSAQPVGGAGKSSVITGAQVYYAGGGGGGRSGVAIANGGIGGGGGWKIGPGTANTGGGAGGGNSQSKGGSGIVILAYQSVYPNLSFIDIALTYTLDTTTRPGYKVYKFTAGTGYITVG